MMTGAMKSGTAPDNQVFLGRPRKSSLLSVPAWSFVSLALCFSMILVLFGLGRGSIAGQELCWLIVIVSILAYGLCLSSLFVRSKKLEFLFLFVLISWPFYYGQQLLEAIGYVPVRRMINIGQLTPDGLFNASMFTLLAINILCFAYILFPGKGRRPISRILSPERSRESLRKASFVIFAISVIPTAITLLRNFQLTQLYGYGSRIGDSSLHLHGIENIFGIAAEFMPYSLLGLLIARRKGERWPVIFLVIYLACYIASGSRTQGFILLVSIAVVWATLFSKSSPMRQIVTIGVGVVTVAALFSFVSLARAYVSSDIVALSNAMQEANPLFDAVQEAGQTIVVLGTVMENTPKAVPYADGSTYLAGLAYVLPNAVTGNYYASVPSVDEVFQGFLTSYGGVGSSFIAEAYYNFGYGALLTMAVYGWLLRRLQNEFLFSIADGRYYSAFACVSCFAICSFYVRSDARTFLRNFIWRPLPLLAVEWLLRRYELRFLNNSAGFLGKHNEARFGIATAHERREI